MNKGICNTGSNECECNAGFVADGNNCVGMLPLKKDINSQPADGWLRPKVMIWPERVYCSRFGALLLQNGSILWSDYYKIVGAFCYQTVAVYVLTTISCILK